jgi:guanine deaminase
MPQSPARIAHRGAVLHFLGDPGDAVDTACIAYHEDGLLLIDGGRVLASGPANELLSSLPSDTPVVHHAGKLLMPGFIDTHIHYPQTDVIASGGRQLLDWLSDYTFPAEARFGDAGYARQVADFFLDELLRNGTTTALVFGTVHAESVTAFMQAAEARQLRMIAGKAMMDRNCPDNLRDTAASSDADNRALIETWHGRGRLHYAITPRFAATSSEAQLRLAGQLAAQHPDVFIHSHLAENHAEIAWIRELFPDSRSYLDVYERFGLVRERAVYAHCLHLDHEDRSRMGRRGAGASFCPTSNLYLGSGLFDIGASDAAGLRFGMGTDVGGGSSFSMLRTLAAAYTVAQMRHEPLSPIRAFYLATRGGARVLRLEDRIGSFEPGREADFIVIDPQATPLLGRRWAQSRTLAEKLLVLMTLGDDRAIAQCHVLGQAQAGPDLHPKSETIRQ